MAFDAVGVNNFKRSFSTLKPAGMLVTYGFYSKSLDSEPGDSFQMIKEFLKWKWLQLSWKWLANKGRSASVYSITDLRASDPEGFKEDLAVLFLLLHNKDIAPKIWKTFPLAEVVQAHQLLEEGKVRGKIVIKMVE